MKANAILLTAVLLGSAVEARAQQPQPDPDEPTDTQPAPGDPDDPIPAPAQPEQPATPDQPAEPETTPPEPTPPPAEPPPVVVEPPPTETTVTVTPTPVRVTPVVEETTYVDRIGMSLTLGAGLTSFIDADTRDFTNPGGGWSARLAIGTRELIGLEVGYTGSAQEIEALGLDEDAILVSNGLDAALRLNLGPEAVVQPFLFGGMGWRHYTVTNVDTNTSSINESDDVLEFPVGAGLGYRAAGVNLELRGTFRPVSDSNLIGGRDTGDLDPGDLDPIDDPSQRDSESTLHNWSATLGAGWEF